jgi:hypothetical protein
MPTRIDTQHSDLVNANRWKRREQNKKNDTHIFALSITYVRYTLRTHTHSRYHNIIIIIISCVCVWVARIFLALSFSHQRKHDGCQGKCYVNLSAHYLSPTDGWLRGRSMLACKFFAPHQKKQINGTHRSAWEGDGLRSWIYDKRSAEKNCRRDKSLNIDVGTARRLNLLWIVSGHQ